MLSKDEDHVVWLKILQYVNGELRLECVSKLLILQLAHFHCGFFNPLHFKINQLILDDVTVHFYLSAAKLAEPDQIKLLDK